MSGMLAPVGVGISGALLIVGALYGVRTLHRKRRNNLKRQRKTRQQEVSAFAVFLVNNLPRFESVSLLLSNPEKAGAAARTRPCCWPTAPKTSSDRRERKKKQKTPHRYDNRVSTHPEAVWLGLV